MNCHGQAAVEERIECASGLLREVRACFEALDDPVQGRGLCLAECLMSGLAVFGLKYPSLLQFDRDARTDELVRANLKRLYGIERAPCDTALRERLDEVDPRQLRAVFKRIFTLLQRGKGLEGFTCLDGHYLLSVDGTGYFSSSSVHCAQCCEKHHRDGRTTYYHQMLVVVEDALASNGPHIKHLKELDLRFILGAKRADHEALFEWVEATQRLKHSAVKHVEHRDERGIHHRFRYLDAVPLNDTHFELEVNFLEYWERRPDGREQHFAWVTDLPIDEVVRAIVVLALVVRARFLQCGWRRARRSLSAEQVHDEAGDGDLRADERGGLDPQGAVELATKAGDGGLEVGLRGQLRAIRPGRGAGRVHDGFRHRFIGAGFPECLDGGVGVEGGGAHVPGRALKAAWRRSVEAGDELHGGDDADQAPRQPGFEGGELGINTRFEGGEVGA